MADIKTQPNGIYTLAKKAHHGDAESMFQLAVRAYWGYDVYPGLENRENIFELLHAAGQHGGGAINRKIGDFFRNEYMENEAQIHYIAALEKDLAQAEKGNANAMFSVAEHYAIGLGVERNDEKAAFWLQEAARKGHKEARAMVFNLWQDGCALAVSEEMSGAWAKRREKMPEAADKDMAALRDAAVKYEIAEDKLAAAKKLKTKKRTKLRVNDRAQTTQAKIRNTIDNLLKNHLDDLFLILRWCSYIALLLTMLFGYKEKGPMHLVNVFLFVAAFMPNYILNLESNTKLGVTTEKICKYLYAPKGDRATFDWILEFAVMFVFLCLLYKLWFFILKKLAKFVIGKCGGGIESRNMTVEKGEVIDYQPRVDSLEKEFAKAKQELDTLVKKFGIPVEYAKSEIILALYDICAFLGISGVAQAVDKYKSIAERREKPAYNILVNDSISPLVNYFVLNRNFPNSTAYAGICAHPKYSFDHNSTFMEGYRLYRRGINFAKAEELFREVIKGTPYTSRAAFAALYVGKMCRNEKLRAENTQEAEKYNRSCMDEAEKMYGLANEYGCMYTRNDEASNYTKLWQMRHDDMMALAEYFSDNSDLCEYYKNMAAADERRSSECGNPLNDGEWNGYRTGCLWSRYVNLDGVIRKAFSQKHIISNQDNLYYFRGLENVANALVQGGIGSAEIMAKSLKECADKIKSDIDYRETLRYLEEHRRRERSRAEFLASQEWERQYDAYERERNVFLTGDYATDFERNIEGRLSNSGYMVSDFLRNEARDKFKKELDKELDSKQ